MLLECDKVEIGNRERRRMNKLMEKIYIKKEILNIWNAAIICLIHKKGGKTTCQNFKALALLSIGYKIQRTIIVKKLKSIMEREVAEYQSGFGKGRDIREKLRLIIDFNQAYDT